MRSSLSATTFALVAILYVASTPLAQQVDFSYHAPGDIERDQGRVGDRWIYLPEIHFPLKEAPSFLNSQVYGPGGYQGPGGSQCATTNYSMPWRDNYCEKRQWAMPLCPTGKGHQGVDIRPSSCDKNKWYVVATEDGRIARVTPNTTIYLRGDSGTMYRYMHTAPDSISVVAGQTVRKGQELAKVSNIMGGVPNTTIHLHLDAKQVISTGGGAQSMYVPPYASLVAAFRRLVGFPDSVEGNYLAVDPDREVD